ncbi:MAG: hypothetical protein COA44_09025 [Arcobacter sp.]|nr:MAG: hypothetical protein COA44_09025 [Arcobacter sp.]
MNIGIIGCGWLGKPLSKYLSKDHQVSCFHRSDTHDIFWKNELFIICISTKDNYLQSLQNFLLKIPSKAKIILMSSTSVYKEFDKEVTEETFIHEKTIQKEAEELMQKAPNKLLILRLGGLMGEDRIAGKWKSVSTFADSPVNYIHQEDILPIVSTFIQKDIHSGIFNLVSPLHPLRSQVHKKNAQDFGFELGNFKGMSQRVVSSNKLIKTLDYNFIYPNPLEFWT